MRTQTPTFYKKAAEGGIAEVEMGEASPGQILKRQRQGIRRHDGDGSQRRERETQIPRRQEKHQTSDQPERRTDGVETSLQALSGDTFDKSYIKGMVEDHQEDIKEFQTEANSGQDPDAKAYAAATLPTLNAHLRRIQAIAAAQGVDVK